MKQLFKFYIFCILCCIYTVIMVKFTNTYALTPIFIFGFICDVWKLNDE